jgi:hypothetical protein
MRAAAALEPTPVSVGRAELERQKRRGQLFELIDGVRCAIRH